MSDIESIEKNYSNLTLPMNKSMVRLEDIIDYQLLKIEVITMATVFILSIAGNSIVVLTLLMRVYMMTGFHKKKLSRMNFYIFHLSIADIYVSLGNTLTMLYWRRHVIFFGGDIMCRIVVYFQVVSLYYSTYVLIAMSIDRYEAICKPLIGLSWTKKKGKTYIGIAFLLAHLQGLPQIGLFSLRKLPNIYPDTYTCYADFNPLWLEKAYVVYTSIMQFLIPLIIIVICYVNISVSSFRGIGGETVEDKSTENINSSINMVHLVIPFRRKSSKMTTKRRTISEVTNRESEIKKNEYFSIRREKRTVSFSINRSFIHNSQKTPSTNSTNTTIMRRHCSKSYNTLQKFKTIKLTLTVIILYIICSTPYFCGIFVLAIAPQFTMNTGFLKYAMVLSCLLWQLNSCVNPWIYLTFNFKRENFRKLLSRTRRDSGSKTKTNQNYSSRKCLKCSDV